jgi:hypothetical protein
MLSINSPLSERLNYAPAEVSPDELHDAALELEAWRKTADDPAHVEEMVQELEDLRQQVEDLQGRELLHWSSSSGRIELQITREQARSAAHGGQCDNDVKALSQNPMIAGQLSVLAPEMVSNELRDYGAWDAEELADHEQNLQRLLWCACGDLNEMED